MPGESAFLWIDLDNSECDLDVTNISGVLNQSITLRANGGRTRVINKNLVTETIPGIPARSHAKDENRKTMSL